ncbi:MAG: HopJ type III effector protein [Pseudomonadales bacterium]|nr:HopJ type III effector protein [Pseudomonadales bacterium]
MTVSNLIEKLRSEPESIEFDDVMKVISENYDYAPTPFSNGEVLNEAGSNEGSCKIFAFAQLNNLSEMETLSLFGKFYREDVIANPAASDHANIRNFILDGWLGIRFDGEPLRSKQPN